MPLVLYEVNSLEYITEKELSVKERILSRLNEQQRIAAVNYNGACAINAVPGSGKTATLIARAAFMIEDGVSPRNILLFTFTRKAAQEIKERVQAQIGEKANGITVGTYHSFCMRLLRRYADYLGWTKNFSIYDEEDKMAVLKPLCKAAGEEATVIASRISHYKQNLMSPVMAAQRAENKLEIASATIYQQYAQIMKESNAFDFDDLIYFAIKLMEEYSDVRKEVNHRYTYITCDEAHDSSVEDLRLIELLGGKIFNVCLILDCDQSIYGFRGANMCAVYEYMDKHNFVQYMLERNYRSTQTIVNAARSMIINNDEPIQKKGYSKNVEGMKIVCTALGDAKDEANYIVRVIKTMSKKGYTHKDIAVLYRMQYLSRSMEEALLKNSIPYQIVGGCPFYNRKEIKDVLSYAKFLVNPYDLEAFKRIINVPKRGIGEKNLEKIISCYKHLSCDTIPTEGLLQACKEVECRGKVKLAMEQFITIISQLTNFAEINTPVKVIDEILRLTGYTDYLEKTELDTVDERIDNLIELEEIAAGYTDLQEFLNNMILNTQKTNDNTGGEELFDGVNLMSMHASKGLEFPVVIMIGSNEGTIPHFKAIQANDVSEERRLFYVAMTRAKELLFITRPKVTVSQGVPKYSSQSRFIKEIDPEYVKLI